MFVECLQCIIERKGFKKYVQCEPLLMHVHKSHKGMQQVDLGPRITGALSY